MSDLMLRLRRLLGELDYAQRRTLELRTGRSFTGPRLPSRAARREVDQLNATWMAGREETGSAATSVC